MNRNIEKIEDYIYKHKILIDECVHLEKFNKAALYCNINNKDIILLNSSFKNRNISEKLEILSEEIGHFSTSVGDTFIKLKGFSQKIMSDKTEKKAVIWGANYLITMEDIKKYISISSTVEELTDYLGVTQFILYEYLYNLKKKERYIYLENGKVDLYKLPNIYIEGRD